MKFIIIFYFACLLKHFACELKGPNICSISYYEWPFEHYIFPYGDGEPYKRFLKECCDGYKENNNECIPICMDCEPTEVPAIIPANVPTNVTSNVLSKIFKPKASYGISVAVVACVVTLLLVAIFGAVLMCYRYRIGANRAIPKPNTEHVYNEVMPQNEYEVPYTYDKLEFVKPMTVLQSHYHTLNINQQ